MPKPNLRGWLAAVRAYFDQSLAELLDDIAENPIPFAVLLILLAWMAGLGVCYLAYRHPTVGV